MTFPKSLIKGNRREFPEDKISTKNLMYARHKPGYDWNEGDDYPDLSKIKIDQSFNWSAYSLPCWARFNPNKVYQSEYGVVGYSVNKIRNPINDLGESILVVNPNVNHKPEDNNYSHCELVLESPITKSLKREYRTALKHRSVVYLRPHQKPSKILFIDYLKMYWHKLLHWLSGSKEGLQH